MRLEYRAGLKNIANTLMAKALQECPSSGEEPWQAGGWACPQGQVSMPSVHRLVQLHVVVETLELITLSSSYSEVLPFLFL